MVFSSFAKYLRITLIHTGTDTTAVPISARGCAICTPKMGRAAGIAHAIRYGRPITTGMKNRPCRANDSRLAGTTRPMVWVSMVHITVHAIKGKLTHCSRRATVPMAMTSPSVLNNPTKVGAKIRPATDATSSSAVPSLTQNQNASLTRPYSPAP